MKFEPHPYQLEAMRFLISRPHAGLLLPVGLGKTVCSLTVIEMLRQEGLLKRTLVVAPIRSLYTVWTKEAKKWDNLAGLTVKNLHAEEFDGDVEIINPHQLYHYLDKYPGRWDHLVVDESTDFKNHKSFRFRQLRSQLHRFPRRWILTGSPAPNGLQDIWAQAFILDRGDALGRFITHFRRMYCMDVSEHFAFPKWRVRPEMADTVYDRLRPIMFRISAEEAGLKLPALVKNRILVELPPKARKEYDLMEKEFFTIVEGEGIESPNAAAAGMRCRQIANGRIYVPNGGGAFVTSHSEKVQALVDLVNEQQGAPVLVFYEFKHDAAAIRQALGYVPNITEDGDTEKIVDEWNAGKYPVLLAQSQSASKSLNLQGSCAAVCFFGIPWALDNYEQGIGRVLRQGNEAQSVVVHHIVANDTLDLTVEKVLAEKAHTQDELNKALTRRANVH